MKSLANRPLFRQISITLSCIAAGVFVGVLSGMISAGYPHFKQTTSELLLPTVYEELSQEQYEIILAQPHSCRDYLYLEDQIKALQMSRSSMQEIKSEIVLEQLDAIDQAIENLKQTQLNQLEQIEQIEQIESESKN